MVQSVVQSVVQGAVHSVVQGVVQSVSYGPEGICWSVDDVSSLQGDRTMY